MPTDLGLLLGSGVGDPPWWQRLMALVSGHRPIVDQSSLVTPPVLPANVAQVPTRAPDRQAAFAQNGVLREQQVTDPRVANALYQAVTPAGYGWYNDQVGMHANPDGENRIARFLLSLAGSQISQRSRVSPYEEAAWKMYLGLPLSTDPIKKPGDFLDNPYVQDVPDGTRERDLYRVSQYKPASARNPRAIYYSIPEQFIMPDRRISWIQQAVAAKQRGQDRIVIDAGPGLPFQHFTLSTGQDEKGPYVSYYDIWDLNMPGASRVGKPFELYDRIYYDPETGLPRSLQQRGLSDFMNSYEAQRRYKPLRQLSDQLDNGQITMGQFDNRMEQLRNTMEFRDWARQQLAAKFRTATRQQGRR